MKTNLVLLVSVSNTSNWFCFDVLSALGDGLMVLIIIVFGLNVICKALPVVSDMPGHVKVMALLTYISICLPRPCSLQLVSKVIQNMYDLLVKE